MVKQQLCWLVLWRYSVRISVTSPDILIGVSRDFRQCPYVNDEVALYIKWGLLSSRSFLTPYSQSSDNSTLYILGYRQRCYINTFNVIQQINWKISRIIYEVYSLFLIKHFKYKGSINTCSMEWKDILSSRMQPACRQLGICAPSML
jgi:hypothetical protein